MRYDLRVNRKDYNGRISGQQEIEASLSENLTEKENDRISIFIQSVKYPFLNFLSDEVLSSGR